MCGFVVDVIDVKTLDVKKKKALNEYLVQRKNELEERLDSLKKAIKKLR
jgi:hypothetical protein